MDRRGFLRWAGKAGAGAAFGGVSGRVLAVDGAVAHHTWRDGVELADAATPWGGQGHMGIQRTLWSVPTASNLVALTFDDGPDREFTPTILRVLDQAGVRATFNVMGWNANKNPDLLRQAVAAGHEIGNHTWTHRDLALESVGNTFREIRRGASAIEDVVQIPIRYFRPPRGEVTGTALRAASSMGYDILLWSVTRGPHRIGTPASVTTWVVGKATPGAIVGLHDGIGRGTFDRSARFAKDLVARRSVEVEALPGILAGIRARGMDFATVSDLVKHATSV